MIIMILMIIMIIMDYHGRISVPKKSHPWTDIFGTCEV